MQSLELRIVALSEIRGSTDVTPLLGCEPDAVPVRPVRNTGRAARWPHNTRDRIPVQHGQRHSGCEEPSSACPAISRSSSLAWCTLRSSCAASFVLPAFRAPSRFWRAIAITRRTSRMSL